METGYRFGDCQYAYFITFVVAVILSTIETRIQIKRKFLLLILLFLFLLK